MADSAGRAANLPAVNPSPSEKDELTHDQLLDQLQPMIQNAHSPELVILHLMLSYSFSISHLKNLLNGNVMIAMVIYPASQFTLTNYSGSQQI